MLPAKEPAAVGIRPGRVILSLCLVSRRRLGLGLMLPLLFSGLLRDPCRVLALGV